jgi:hypothetical protein
VVAWSQAEVSFFNHNSSIACLLDGEKVGRLNGDVSVKDRLRQDCLCHFTQTDHYDFMHITAIKVDCESSCWANI